jgi:hypothetical protein
MRCLICGAEMSLEQVIGEDCPPGFERRTFLCSVCGDTEQRLAPIQQIEPSTPAAVAMVAAPSVAPLCSEKNEDPAPPGPPSLAPLCSGKDEHSAPPGAPSLALSCFEKKDDPAPPGMIKRIFGNLSALYGAVGHRRSVVRDQVTPRTMPTASPPEPYTEVQPLLEAPNPGLKPVLTCIASPTLVAAEPASEVDDCEALLTRAIELVRTPTRSNPEMQPEPSAKPRSEEQVKSSHVSTRVSEAEIAFPSVQLTSSNRPQSNSEALTQSNGVQKADSVAWARSGYIPKQAPTRSVMPEHRPANSIVVEIQYDSARAKYIAKDIHTGLSILRITDHERLRQMCDRMGWQVVNPVLGTD